MDLLPTSRTRVPHIEAELTAALKPATDMAPVREVRVLGAVGVVQLDGPVDVPGVTRAALERGVWVRPFRDLVYTMPPYVAGPDDIAAIGAGIIGAIAQVHC